MKRLIDFDKEQHKYRTVVKKSTSSWYCHKSNQLHIKTSLRVLKRKSNYTPLLKDEFDNIGGDVVGLIKNLHTVPDGVYCLDVCDIIHNWEDSTIDDYSLFFNEYKETVDYHTN